MNYLNYIKSVKVLPEVKPLLQVCVISEVLPERHRGSGKQTQAAPKLCSVTSPLIYVTTKYMHVGISPTTQNLKLP